MHLEADDIKITSDEYCLAHCLLGGRLTRDVVNGLDEIASEVDLIRLLVSIEACLIVYSRQMAKLLEEGEGIHGFENLLFAILTTHLKLPFDLQGRSLEEISHHL